MPNYGLPGVPMSRRGSRALGAAALALTVAAGLTWRAGLDDRPPDRLQVQLRTEQIGEGVVEGTRVRYDGVTVGEITEIAAVGAGHQLLTLDLDKTQTAGLTDALTVDYAPENLFGISALTLRAAAGGAPLTEGGMIDLAGAHADKVTDVTMGSLLRALTATSTEVLTPELSELLATVNSEMSSFAPLWEAIVTLSRAVADTQRYPAPYLIDQYAAFFGGMGDFASATFRLLHAVMNIEIFRNDRPRYDATITMVVDGALPKIGLLGDAANRQLAGYTAELTPLVAALAATVPAPGRSRAEAAALVDRLERLFSDTPDGPALNVAVTLGGMPGLAVPLLGPSGFAAIGAGGAR
ncbi:MlaD family protein [Nocardia xishanensis]